MPIVGRLDQYASMLAWEFDETTANNMSITGLGTYYSSEFNENIVDIVRNGLVLNLDAGNLSSYPGSGTTWTDVSRNSNNGTLTNGPTYSSANNGSIVFDGVDDYVNCGTPSSGRKITVNAWVKITTGSLNQHIVDSASNAWHLAILSDNRPYFWNGSTYHTAAPVLTVGQWYMLTGVQGTTLDIYINGVLGQSIASNVNVTTNNVNLGRYQSGGRQLTGNISNVQVYNRVLTEAEIQQNYNAFATRYGLTTTNSTAPMSANVFAPYDPVYDEFSGTFFGAGQGRYMRQNTDNSVIAYNEIDEITDLFGRGIVRDGLVLDLDAGISASYPGSGTTWTDLSVYSNNGTLTNGPTYSSANGGSIVFDGTNDYVTLPTNLLIHETGNPFTFSIWFKTSSTGIILGQTNTSNPTAAITYVPAIYVGTNGLLYTSCFWGGATSNQSVSLSSVNNGSWNNITVTFASNSQISYLNGVSYATLSKTQSNYSPTYYYFLGSGTGTGWTNIPASFYFNGNISNTLYYNRALSAAEISQNYNALKGRYGL